MGGKKVHSRLLLVQWIVHNELPVGIVLLTVLMAVQPAAVNYSLNEYQRRNVLAAFVK
jgi:hypothetical protein